MKNFHITTRCVACGRDEPEVDVVRFTVMCVQQLTMCFS